MTDQPYVLPWMKKVAAYAFDYVDPLDRGKSITAIVAAIAAIAPRQDMRERWHSAETAPKDGSKILVYTHQDEIEISEWYESPRIEYVEVENGLYKKKVIPDIGTWNGNSFTHWMPLPPSPSINCPICGSDKPHEHSGKEIHEYLKKLIHAAEKEQP